MGLILECGSCVCALYEGVRAAQLDGLILRCSKLRGLQRDQGKRAGTLMEYAKSGMRVCRQSTRRAV